MKHLKKIRETDAGSIDFLWFHGFFTYLCDKMKFKLSSIGYVNVGGPNSGMKEFLLNRLSLFHGFEVQATKFTPVVSYLLKKSDRTRYKFMK